MDDPRLSLRQVVAILGGALEAGADPDLPLGVYIGDQVAFVTQISLTEDDGYTECDLWVGRP